MKEIFENLYESVSETCFEDIMSMVEELLSEGREEGETLAQYKERLENKKYNEVLPKLEDKESGEKAYTRNLKKKLKGGNKAYKSTKKSFMNAQKENSTNKGKYEATKSALQAMSNVYGTSSPHVDQIGNDHLANAVNYAKSQSNLEKVGKANKEAKKIVTNLQKRIDQHSQNAEGVRNKMEKLEPGWTKGRAENQKAIRGEKTKESKIISNSKNNNLKSFLNAVKTIRNRYDADFPG